MTSSIDMLISAIACHLCKAVTRVQPDSPTNQGALDGCNMLEGWCLAHCCPAPTQQQLRYAYNQQAADERYVCPAPPDDHQPHVQGTPSATANDTGTRTCPLCSGDDQCDTENKTMQRPKGGHTRSILDSRSPPHCTCSSNRRSVSQSVSQSGGSGQAQ